MLSNLWPLLDTPLYQSSVTGYLEGSLQINDCETALKNQLINVVTVINSKLIAAVDTQCSDSQLFVAASEDIALSALGQKVSHISIPILYVFIASYIMIN